MVGPERLANPEPNVPKLAQVLLDRHPAGDDRPGGLLPRTNLSARKGIPEEKRASMRTASDVGEGSVAPYPEHRSDRRLSDLRVREPRRGF